MRQNNLSHHSSPCSLYSASSTQIVESDREVLWLKVDCVLPFRDCNVPRWH